VAPAEVTAAMGAEPTDEQDGDRVAARTLRRSPAPDREDLRDGRARGYLALGALGRVDAPGVMPGNVLRLTFTNKATENPRLRVRRALAHLGCRGRGTRIMNYHGLRRPCSTVRRARRVRAGRPRARPSAARGTVVACSTA
jgi:hypothetical protein